MVGGPRQHPEDLHVVFLRKEGLLGGRKVPEPREENQGQLLEKQEGRPLFCTLCTPNQSEETGQKGSTSWCKSPAERAASMSHRARSSVLGLGLRKIP